MMSGLSESDSNAIQRTRSADGKGQRAAAVLGFRNFDSIFVELFLTQNAVTDIRPEFLEDIKHAIKGDLG